jgi:hypothetical protein
MGMKATPFGATKRVLVGAVVWFVASSVVGQQLDECPPAGDASYGPFDYRTATRDQKHIVEVTGGHFTPSVEALKSGTTGTVGGELAYTLGVFPNHPRALMAMIRLGQRDKTNKPYQAKFTIDCYVERAVQFRPDDMQIRQVRGVYHALKKRYDAAIADFSMVVEQEPDNGNAHYNLGLAYFETGNYQRARAEAKKAHALGFQLPGLREKLKAKGKWDE